MLFEPDRHEALGATAWDEARARDTIRGIVGNTERSRIAEAQWPCTRSTMKATPNC